MRLKDIGYTLPPGFGFYPTDKELVCHYLYKKITNEDVDDSTTLVEIDLHTCEPWQLPDVAKLNSSEWYFFNFRDRKYTTGFRTNRATTSGYWKATGKDRAVTDPSSQAVVGMRKTLVFYKNRAPNGVKTGWIMHEFRLENPNFPPKEDWVLCRVFHKFRGESNSEFHPTHIQDLSTDVIMHTCIPNSWYNPNSISVNPSLHQSQQNHLDRSLEISFGLIDPSVKEDCHGILADYVINNNETKCEQEYKFLNGGLHENDIDHENTMVWFSCEEEQWK